MKVRDREGPQQPLAALEGSPSLGVAHAPTRATGPIAAVPGVKRWGEAPGRRARGVNDELGDGVLLGFLMGAFKIQDSRFKIQDSRSVTACSSAS